MRTLRLGLLSTARINGVVLAAAAATGCFDVSAVASREAERAESYARERGISRSYGTYDGLLHDPDVDAVYISLPNHLHHEWTMRALAAGKHVLCEKPYTRHPSEAEEAFASADERGLVLAEGLMYRHHPQTAIVADLVASGAVGRLRMITATLTLQMRGPDDPRLRRDVDRGSLMEAGCYCVSASRLLAGEPGRAYGKQTLDDAGIDVAFHGTLRFADDVLARFHCSYLAGRQQRLEAVGDRGTLVVEAPFRQDWGGSVVLTPLDGRPRRIDVPSANSYALELANFASAVADGEQPLLGREDALGQARAINALRRSADERRPVEL